MRQGGEGDQDALLTQQQDVLPRRQLRAGACGHLTEDAGPGAERRQRLGGGSRFLPAPHPHHLLRGKAWGTGRAGVATAKGRSPSLSSLTERDWTPGGGISQPSPPFPSPPPPPAGQGVAARAVTVSMRPGPRPRGGAGGYQRFCPSSSSPPARSSALLLVVAVAADEGEEKPAAEPSPDEEEPKEPALPTAAAIFAASSLPRRLPETPSGRQLTGTRMLGGRGAGPGAGARGGRRRGSRARALPPQPLFLRASRLPPHSEGLAVPTFPPSSQVFISRPGRGEGGRGWGSKCLSFGLSPAQVGPPQWSEVKRPPSAFVPVTAARCCCGAGSCRCVPSAVCSLGSPSPEGSTLHPRKVSAARGETCLLGGTWWSYLLQEAYPLLVLHS